MFDPSCANTSMKKYSINASWTFQDWMYSVVRQLTQGIVLIFYVQKFVQRNLVPIQHLFFPYAYSWGIRRSIRTFLCCRNWETTKGWNDAVSYCNVTPETGFRLAVVRDPWEHSYLNAKGEIFLDKRYSDSWRRSLQLYWRVCTRPCTWKVQFNDFCVHTCLHCLCDIWRLSVSVDGCVLE